MQIFVGQRDCLKYSILNKMAGLHVTGTEKKSGERKVYGYGRGLRKRNKLKYKLKIDLKRRKRGKMSKIMGKLIVQIIQKLNLIIV